MVKNPPASAGGTRDMGWIPGLRRFSEEGSCLENSMVRRVWQATVHGVAKGQTWLSKWTHTQTPKTIALTKLSPFDKSAFTCTNVWLCTLEPRVSGPGAPLRGLCHLSLWSPTPGSFYHKAEHSWFLKCICWFIGKWKWKSLSGVQLFATPWTIQSMEFSRPG